MNASAPAARARRSLAELPRPPGLPLLGNLLQVEPARLHLAIEQWSRQYGALFQFQLGRRRFLVIGDHVAVAAVLRDRPDGFRRTERLDEIWREMGFHPGLFGANGEAWQRQRRMVMAGFDPAHVRAYFPSLAKVVQRLQGRWLKAARGGASIDLQADLIVEACAHETMRLHPVAPVLALQAVHDTVVDDVFVPAGTVVLTMMRRDSVSEAHFANPRAFEPERWLADGSQGHAAGSAKRVSMPFGAGPRVCPGRYLALLEMKMAMAMLLGRFEIDSVVTADGGEVREHLAFAMAPVGLRLRLRERV